MRAILVDGSNVGLYSANAGKLTTLTGLARVLNALLAHEILPYTMFDASFRYRTSEKSAARTEFSRLTKELGDFFPLAPAGEQADLFLLEAALATGYPVLSNDTYRDYGEMKDGELQYKGGGVAVHHFSVIASSVIIPSLEIRRKVAADDDRLDDIASKLSAVCEAGERREADDACEQKAAATSGVIEVDGETLSGIDSILNIYVATGARPLNSLGNELADYKRDFAAKNGVGKQSKRIWFGFPTLRLFIEAAFPHYALGENSIERRAPGA